MQQRDQPRTAFVNEAKFLFAPGTDLARRARQRGGDKGFQGLFLHGTQKARAAAYVKTREPLDAALLKQLVPAADRVVVQQKRCRNFLTAPPVVQQHQSVRPPRQARRRRAVARQRDQMLTILRAEKAAANHAPSESDPQKARKFSRLFNESGYIENTPLRALKHDPGGRRSRAVIGPCALGPPYERGCYRSIMGPYK